MKLHLRFIFGKLAPYFDSLVYVDPTSYTSQIANYENISQDSMQHVVSGFTNSPNPISSNNEILFLFLG